MDCEILRTLYVKANGEILCNDDHGEQVVLGIPDYDRDDTGIHRILTGENYARIRESFAAGRVPWPGICDQCALLRRREPWSGDLLAARVIERIQFEPSLACALKCPSCCNRAQIRARRPPLHFPVAWMARLLADLAAHGYRTQTIEFCGQGEPLNHPAFRELLQVVRDACPGSRLRLITNGNHDFDAKIGDGFLEETIVSIDGASQAAYERYRVNGRIARALDFLAASARRQIPAGGSVVWKYILLTSNDSDAEIVRAQRLAAEIGVSRIWFVHGHGAMRSVRFGYDGAAAIPVAYPRVKIAAHPAYNRDARSLTDPGGAELVAGSPGAVWLDTLVIQPNRMLGLSGWANSSRRDLLGLALGIGGHPAVAIPLDLPRPDVRAVHPSFRHEACGFDLLLPDPRPDPATAIELEFTLTYRRSPRSTLRKRIALPHDLAAATARACPDHSESARALFVAATLGHAASGSGSDGGPLAISAEIRWFWPAPGPSDLKRWFCDAARHGRAAAGGDIRTDAYLPGEADLGIKLKSDRPGTDVKGLVAVLPAARGAGPFDGPAEIWCKWSAPGLSLAGAALVSVEKRRWLRKFTLSDADADPRELALDARGCPIGSRPPEEGCNVEFTEVSVPGVPAWVTFGFEAFGGLDAVATTLRRTTLLLASRHPPPLTGGWRAAYPAWLQRVQK